MSYPNNKIEKFVQEIRKFSTTKLVNSEENTKKWVVDPLIEILGWKKEDYQLEYPVTIGHSTNSVDYAMLDKGKPVLFLEAKAFSHNLSEEDSEQIISYGRVEGVRWVALTNGRIVKFFDTEEGKKEEDCLVDEIDLLKLPSNFSELEGLLSKDSILTGKVDKVAKQLKEKTRILRSLDQIKDKIAQELKEFLPKILGKEYQNIAEKISNNLSETAIQLLIQELKTTGNGIKEVNREELKGKPDREVIICATRINGVEFLKKVEPMGLRPNKQKSSLFCALRRKTRIINLVPWRNKRNNRTLQVERRT